MSVYSGFATRQQETFYNKLIEKTLMLLCSKTLATFKGDGYNDWHFVKHMQKMFKYMVTLDKNKYLSPKFSDTLQPLYSYMQKHFDHESTSTLTSCSFMQENRSEMSATHGVGRSHSRKAIESATNSNVDSQPPLTLKHISE